MLTEMAAIVAKLLERLVELVGIELLNAVDNTHLIDSYSCQKTKKGTSPNHWVHFRYSDFSSR